MMQHEIPSEEKPRQKRIRKQAAVNPRGPSKANDQ